MGDQANIHTFDVEKHLYINTLEGEEGVWFTSLAGSSDDTMLLAGDDKGTIHAFEATNMEIPIYSSMVQAAYKSTGSTFHIK